MSLTKDTISGVKWTYIEKLSVQIVNFLVGLLLARLLSPDDFGLISMLGIFMAISQTMIDSGFPSALIRKIDVNERDYSTAFVFNVGVGLFCYAILFLCSGLIARFFKTPELCQIIKVYALVLPINSLSSAQYARLNHDLNFKFQAQVSLISVLISGTAGVALAFLGFGVWALVWQAISCAFLKTVLLFLFSQWKPSISFSVKSFKYLLSFGSKLLAAGMLHTIYQNFTSLAIGKFYSPTDLGYYYRGAHFATIPSDGLTTTFQKVTFPLFSQLQNDTERLAHVYRKYIKMTSILVFFLMTLLAALAKPVVVTLLTDKWMSSVQFLQILCFSYMFNHISTLNLNLLKVIGRSDLFLRLEIIKKSISFAILVAAIPLGVRAICVSAIIYTQIAVFINTYYTGKLFNLGYFAQIKDFSKYFLCSLLSCSPAYALTLLPINNILAMVFGAVISAALYYLLLFRDPAFIELKTKLLQTLKKK